MTTEEMVVPIQHADRPSNASAVLILAKRRLCFRSSWCAFAYYDDLGVMAAANTKMRTAANASQSWTSNMTAVADQSPDLLQEFALTLIAPLLASGGIGDPTIARRTAIDTIAAYKAAGRDQLVSVIQLIGFAMVSLDSLRLSLPAELSLAMKLKLRGNANALNRSAQRNTATLAQQRREADRPPPEDDTVATAAAVASLEQALVMVTAPEVTTPKVPAPKVPAPEVTTPEVPAPAKTQPQGSDDQERRRLWANAMTDVAAECSRNLNKLPPAQRRAEIIRIGALSATVQQLMRENRSDMARSGQHALQK